MRGLTRHECSGRGRYYQCYASKDRGGESGRKNGKTKSTQWLLFFLEIWWVFKEGEEKKVGDQTGDENGQNEVKIERKEHGEESQIMGENKLEERKFSDQEGLCMAGWGGSGGWWGMVGRWGRRGKGA